MLYFNYTLQLKWQKYKIVWFKILLPEKNIFFGE